MTDFGIFMRPGYRNSDPIAQAWITGILGGLVVAVIVSVVVYYDTAPQLPLTATVHETQFILPLMPAPPEAPKP
jgi:hypothetical protein